MTNFVSSETALPPDRRGAVLLWQDRVAGRPADWAAERLLETGFLSNGRFVLPDSRTERDAWFAGLFALFPELSPLGEKLPLRSGDETIALVDRRLFRPLGLPTVCVRLWILEGERFWLGKRSATKRIGPGLWDSPVGGLLSGEESPREALFREAYEEAGLDLQALPLTEGPRFEEDRLVPEGRLVETTVNRVLRVSTPPVLTARDGEVERFESFSVEEVRSLIRSGRMLPDAARSWSALAEHR